MRKPRSNAEFPLNVGSSTRRAKAVPAVVRTGERRLDLAPAESALNLGLRVAPRSGVGWCGGVAARRRESRRVNSTRPARTADSTPIRSNPAHSADLAHLVSAAPVASASTRRRQQRFDAAQLAKTRVWLELRGRSGGTVRSLLGRVTLGGELPQGAARTEKFRAVRDASGAISIRPN